MASVMDRQSHSSPKSTDRDGVTGSDHHGLGGSYLKAEGNATSLLAGEEAATLREACGTSTTADSPPGCSPMGSTLATSPVGENAQQRVVPMSSVPSSSPTETPTLSGPPSLASASCVGDDMALDAVAAAAATVAVEAMSKLQEPRESRTAELLENSARVASSVWKSARITATTAAAVTASRVATTDFSALSEATAKPLRAAAEYVGLGSYLGSCTAAEKDKRDGEHSEGGATLAVEDAPEPAGSADGSRFSGNVPVPVGKEGVASYGWSLGSLRVPVLPLCFCAPNAGRDKPLSCTVAVAVADAETELEGSDAEAAAAEYMTSNASACIGIVNAGAPTEEQDRPQTESPLGAGDISDTPGTPRVVEAVEEHSLHVAEGFVAGRNKKSHSGDREEVRSCGSHDDRVGATKGSLHGMRDNVHVEDVNEKPPEVATRTVPDKLQEAQHQKQTVWASLRSTLADSSRRSVEVAQQVAGTAASAASVANKALDALVLPLFGACMTPQARADGGISGLAESSPEQARSRVDPSVNQPHVQSGGEQAQSDQPRHGESGPSSSGLLSELQRRQQALAEAVRDRSINFVQHSVALTASSNFSEARYHLAEIVDTGGPEVSGVWAGVKVGLGIATLASGHLILGGAMVAVATSSLGSALLWGRHRQEVYEIMRGDYPEGGERYQSSEVSYNEEGAEAESGTLISAKSSATSLHQTSAPTASRVADEAALADDDKCLTTESTAASGCAITAHRDQ